MKNSLLKIIRFFCPENKMIDPKRDLETGRNIAERMYSSIIKATWYSELLKRVAAEGNQDIYEAFNRSFEWWGLRYSSEALHEALVMTLTRIVYGDRENTASLLNLIEILKKKGVFKLLEDENIKHGRKLSCDLHELQKRGYEIKGDHRLKKINDLRKTEIGHLAIKHDPKKHTIPDDYGDASKLLEKIRPVVVLCKNLLKDPSSNGSDNHTLMEEEIEYAQKTANEFWEYAAHLRENLSDRED